MGQRDVFTPADALRSTDVLYVGGETHRRDTMRRLLLSLGARRVQVAESGPEALKVVLGTHCSLVIAEHRMTPMGGIQLVRAIRAVSNYPRALVPALVLGEPVGPDVIAAALQAGANHFLVKPLSAATLYARIHWAISDSRAFEIRDGHYVIKTTKPKPPMAAAVPAATK